MEEWLAYNGFINPPDFPRQERSVKDQDKIRYKKHKHSFHANFLPRVPDILTCLSRREDRESFLLSNHFRNISIQILSVKMSCTMARYFFVGLFVMLCSGKKLIIYRLLV